MEVLLFLIGLFLFSLIAHGFWVFAGWLFRALLGTNRVSVPAARWVACPRCGLEQVVRGRERCSECGLEFDSPVAQELTDLQATLRQLRRFQREASVDNGAFEQLQAQVESRHRQLTRPAPAPRPTPEPVKSPAPVEVPAASIAEVAPPPPPAEEPLPVELLPEAPPPPVLPKPAPEPVAVSAVVPVEEVEAIPEPPPAPPPRPPHRSLTELLAAFMEQRNILWGELVGGLLIVGCSVALVISLWKTLEENPLYQFGIFVGVTAGLFGAGLYTLNHWKLESTSRGLLVIATLLVPLNLLAITTAQVQGGGWVIVAAELAALAVFGWLLELAGKVLVPEGRWWCTLAVLGASASQLLVPRVLHAPEVNTGWLVLLLGLIPAACHALGTGAVLVGIDRKPLRAAQTHSLFALLGTATFALAVALGLLVFWSVRQGSSLGEALERLAVLISLAGLPAVVAGVHVQRGLEAEEEAGSLRTAGTGLALTGMVVMLAGLVLAWPRPVDVLVVSALDFLALTYVAFRHRLPVVHALALPCLMMGYLAGWHLLPGWLPEGADLDPWLALSADSSEALVGLVLLLGVAAELLCRSGLQPHGTAYALGSAGIALVSLFGITWPTQGLGGIYAPAAALVVYGVYGAGGVALNLRWRRPLVSSLSLALLAAATLWGLAWLLPGQTSWWGAVLAAEALLMGILAVRLGHPCPPELARAFAEPLARSGEAIGLIALVAAVWGGVTVLAWSPAHVVAGGCLFGLFLLLAAVEARTLLARVAGLMLTATAAAGAGWVFSDSEQSTAWIALSIAGSASILAGMAVRAAPVRRMPDETGPAAPSAWYGVLARAWLDMAAVAGVLALALVGMSLPLDSSPLHTWTGALLAVTALLLAWGSNRVAFTWVGSALALGSITWAWYHWQLTVDSTWLTWPTPLLDIALLSHATLFLCAGLTLERLVPPTTGERVERLLVEPFNQGALLSSVLALPLLVGWSHSPLVVPALGLLWLAVVWLVIAWVNRWPGLFMAFQVVLSLAVVFGTTAWLEEQSWFLQYPPASLGRFVDPRSLQAYGLGLGALSLLWVAARIELRVSPRAQELLESGWPPVDRLVLILLVAGQLLLAILGILPTLEGELFPTRTWETFAVWPPTVAAYTHGAGAWALLALLTVVLLVALRERWAGAAVIGLVVLALTVPVLGAGPFEMTQATGLALRWGLAGCFLTVSLPLWLRGEVGRLAGEVGIEVRPGRVVPLLARGLLIVGAVVPVLLLTAFTAAIELGGGPVLRPVEGSFFAEMPWLLGLTGPLPLIALGLVGYALAERSPAYAFAAGLVVNLTVTGAHALAVVKGQAPLDDLAVEQLAAQLFQLGTTTAAVWAIGWLAVRAWAAGWVGQPAGEGPREESPPAQPLMHGQLGLGTAGNAWLIGFAVWLVATVFPQTVAWTVEAGSALGWLALLTTVSAYVYQARLGRRSVPPQVLGLVELAVVGLAACSVERLWPAQGWGYRTMMLGWAASALAWVVVAGWSTLRTAPRVADTTEAETPHWLGWQQAAELWVHVGGTLALLLGLKAAFWHGEQLWAAAAIAMVSAALALVAVWKRREAEAFVAGLGVKLAASLVVWHYHPSPLRDWWVHLLQANVIAGASVALLWLGWRHWLDGRRGLTLQPTPLLALQVGLALAGNLALLGIPLALLIWRPGAPLPADILPAGSDWGWLAFALTAVSSLWYTVRRSPPPTWGGISLLGGLGLGLGALIACGMGQADAANWAAFHLLMGAWTGVAWAMFAMGWEWSFEEFGRHAVEPWPQLPVYRLLRGWVLAIGFLVVGLALRGTWAGDPTAPYWSAGVTLAISLTFGCVAFWSRQPFEVYASGLLVNVVGGLIWWAQDPGSPETFAFTQVLCLALASAAWSVVEFGLRRLAPLRDLRGGWLPFTHVAATVALSFLGILAVLAVASALVGAGAWAPASLAWPALGLVVVAVLLCLWDATAVFSLGGLYGAGLMAIALALHGAALTPRDFCRAVPLLLAPYGLFAAAAAWIVPRIPELWDLLHVPRRTRGWPEAWFRPAQAALASVVLGLSIWLSVDQPALSDRLTGPLALALLLAAGMLMAGSTSTRWQLGTLALGVVAVTELGWAFLDPADRSDSWLWLHRNVILMDTLALMTVVYGLGLARWLPGAGGWVESGRRLGPVLGVLASLLVAVILAQEALLYQDPVAGAPMAPPAIASVAVALAVLIVAGMCFAVVPGRDPLGLSERGRTVYVYAVEVLLVLMFVHLRLTVPALFRLGLFRQYWPFLVMAVAFAGAGLSEFFNRRRLPVLAEPLERTGVFLPLLPVLAFWVLAPNQYALLWFLTGFLYGLFSVTKRSFRFALLSALAANIGLWVLLHHHEIYFYRHPQLWVIPLALVALVAEHLNRDRLTAAQSGALRYLALVTIYVSSTADMFIAGLGHSVVLPLVLAVLSVLGVLAGMVLRVRAFLFLGVTFLSLVVLTMIWHAGVDRHHTWILWSSGIALGVAILTLFGVFEKRRNEVLRLVEEIRQWD